MTPYTAYPDIQGIIYEDEMNRNRLMHTNELHKFSDGTLNHVCTALNDIATGLEMDYFPKRKWSKQNKKRAHVMIKSDTQVITVKMEILLKPTSNKLMVDALVIRTASAAAKPYQGDSLEFYHITGSIYTDQRGTVVIATLLDEVTKTISSISVDYH
ncbi:hypothetical protein Tco_1319994 [Tanacetum coccineum]